MRTLRQANIKNRQHCFFNSISNIKRSDPSLWSIDQISFKSTDCVIHAVEYFKNLDNKISLYLVFNNVDVYIEEYNEDKYLIFTLTDKKKDALENYTELWDETKSETEALRRIEAIKYEKDFMKIKSEKDDYLPLDRISNIPVCLKIVRSAFQENNKYYPQVFLRECFYEYEYELKDDSYCIV